MTYGGGSSTAQDLPEDVWRLIALCLRDDFDSRQVDRDKRERCHGVEITPIHTARALLSLSSASKTTCSASRGLIFRRVVLADDDWHHALELRNASLAREHIKELLVRVSLDLGNEYLAMLRSLTRLTHLSLHLVHAGRGVSMESFVRGASKELQTLTHLSIDMSCDQVFVADLQRMPLTFSVELRNLCINLHAQAATGWKSCHGIMGVRELSLSPVAIEQAAEAYAISPSRITVEVLRVEIALERDVLVANVDDLPCMCYSAPFAEPGRAMEALVALAPALGACLLTLLLNDMHVETKQLVQACLGLPRLRRLDIHPTCWVGHDECSMSVLGNSRVRDESDVAALSEVDNVGAVDFVVRALPHLLALERLHIGTIVVADKTRRRAFERVIKQNAGPALKLAAIGRCRKDRPHNFVFGHRERAACRPADECFDWAVSELGSMTLGLRDR